MTKTNLNMGKKKIEPFAKGDRVNWLDPVSGELKVGTLWERSQVVAVMSADPYDDRVKDVDYWDWEIYGDDGKVYSIREEVIIYD